MPNPFDEFDTVSAAAPTPGGNPFDEFDAGPSLRITVRPGSREALQGASFAEKAAAPITAYPEALREIQSGSLETVGTGLEQTGRGARHLYEQGLQPERPSLGPIPISQRLARVGDILAGLGKEAGGSLGYVASPISAGVHTVVGQPLKNVFGIPEEISEPVAAAFLPIPKAVPRLSSAERFGENLLFKRPGTIPAEEAFPPRLGRAVERDVTTPQNLAADLAEARQVRPEATLADVGNENVRGLVESLAQTPGPARGAIVPALTERQEQQAGRLSRDLVSLTGTRQSALEATKQTIAARQETAAPLYRRALDEGDVEIWSPNLERLSAANSVKAAMQSAVRNWQDQAIADGYGAMNPKALVERGGQLTSLQGRVPVFPNLQFWDYTKDALDKAYKASVRETGPTRESARLAQFARTIREELDSKVPAYAEARASWAGPSAYLDAIEEGTNITRPTLGADQVRARIAELSPSEREGYITGAVSSIFRRLGNDPARLPDLTKYLRSPEMRTKIDALMPSPEAAAQWNQRLDYEIRSSELTQRALGGPATARRLAEQGDTQGLVADLAATALGHPPSAMGVVRQIGGRAVEKVRTKFQGQADLALADILTNPQSAKLDALLRSPSGGRLRGPIQDYANARQEFQISPTARNIARLSLASRNLSTNLADFGIQLSPDRLISFQPKMVAGEDNQQ